MPTPSAVDPASRMPSRLSFGQYLGQLLYEPSPGMLGQRTGGPADEQWTRSITTLRTVSRRQTAADKPRSLTRVSASTKRRGAVIPFAQQAQSGARGAQI
ncbi:hypothetical protein E4U23_004879 [Claviceps purpurea]|nr:hypothetical protein E4U23_004879 [Claviceps purpurea]